MYGYGFALDPIRSPFHQHGWKLWQLVLHLRSYHVHVLMVVWAASVIAVTSSSSSAYLLPVCSWAQLCQLIYFSPNTDREMLPYASATMEATTTMQSSTLRRPALDRCCGTNTYLVSGSCLHARNVNAVRAEKVQAMNQKSIQHRSLLPKSKFRPVVLRERRDTYVCHLRVPVMPKPSALFVDLSVLLA